MTDYARDLLDEPEEAPPLLAEDRDAKASRRRAGAAEGAALAAQAVRRRQEAAGALPRRPAPPPPSSAAPVRDPVELAQAAVTAPVATPVAAPEQEPVAPAGHGPARSPEPPRTGPSPARARGGPEDRRAALLAATVTALAGRPEQAPVDALLTAYAQAPAAELEHAARAVTATFLRVPATSRRPVREVLQPALRRHARTALAARLSVRLAGAAWSASAPAPTEDT